MLNLHPALPQMCPDTLKLFITIILSLIQRRHHPSHLIGPDESVSANHIRSFMLPWWSPAGRLWRGTAPCWTLTEAHPRGWNKREQIWIFYFWFIEVIIYFFIVSLPMCVGGCLSFTCLPQKCINCKEIKTQCVKKLKKNAVLSELTQVCLSWDSSNNQLMFHHDDKTENQTSVAPWADTCACRGNVCFRWKLLWTCVWGCVSVGGHQGEGNVRGERFICHQAFREKSQDKENNYCVKSEGKNSKIKSKRQGKG